jgi:hypothetical protein
MRIVFLEPFENLVDDSFVCELDRVTMKSDLNSQELMELAYVSDIEFCLESKNSCTH